jgi:sugar phosphate isomerase/epimerase
MPRALADERRFSYDILRSFLEGDDGQGVSMREPWQAHLQLGIVHQMAYPECLGGGGPQFDTLATICHDDAFEAVDVGPMDDDTDRARCGTMLRDCAMTVTFACQPVQLRKQLDLNSAERGERQRAVEEILALLPQASELGASRFCLMSGKNVAAERREAALDALIGSLLTICREARRRAGLPVVLEIFDYDVDKKALVGPCATAARLAAAVRREFPDFGLLHDLSHVYLCHENPATHFPLVREFFVSMHVGNSVSTKGHPLFGDTHPLFGIPGGDSGVPELRNFLKVLFDIGYLRPGRRPVVAFEIRTPTGVAPATAIANAKRTWAQAWWTL